MTRITLPSALASLTCFCIAAGTFRLFTTGRSEIVALWFVVSYTCAMAGFGFLVNQVRYSIFLGLAIPFLICFLWMVVMASFLP